MIENTAPKNTKSLTLVRTLPMRIVFPELFVAKKIPGSTRECFSATLLIDKEDWHLPPFQKRVSVAMNAALTKKFGSNIICQHCIEALIDTGTLEKLDDNILKRINYPIFDGDLYDDTCSQKDRLFAGHWIIHTKANHKPSVFRMQSATEYVHLQENEIKGGDWVVASLGFSGYDGQSVGVVAVLDAICKIRDDEPLCVDRTIDSMDKFAAAPMINWCEFQFVTAENS